jgi:hypothetical protein
VRRLIWVAELALGAATAQAVDPGESAPSFVGKDFSGNEVSFPAVIDGKPTVMTF